MDKNIDFWKKIVNNPTPAYQEYFNHEKLFLENNTQNKEKILAIGCGDGREIINLIDISKEIIGIDNDPKIIIDAKKNLSKYPNVKIELGDAFDLRFKEDTFDCLILLMTFVNFAKNRKKALSEMKRVLKKEGRILMTAYSEDAFDERLRMYQQIGVPIKEIIGTKLIFNESIGANISEQFSKNDLESIFKESGLTIIEIKKKGIGYFCILTK